MTPSILVKHVTTVVLMVGLVTLPCWTALHCAPLSAQSTAMTRGLESFPLPETSSGFALVDVNVVSVVDGQISPHQTIIVSGGKIIAVESTVSTQVPDSIPSFTKTGQFVIPGLWDMHGHLTDWGTDNALRLLVANGVLGVRDMGGQLAALRELQRRVGSGELPGLRILVSGKMLDGPTPNWPHRITVTSPAEGRAAVDNQIVLGVDFIKIHQQLDHDTFRAIAEHSRLRGIAFVGHVPAGIKGTEAASLGQATIEHLTGTPWCRGDDCSRLSELAGSFLQSGVHHVPTLTVYEASVRMSTGGGITDTRTQFVSESIRLSWAQQDSINTSMRPPDVDQATVTQMLDRSRAGALRTTKELSRLDIPLLTGTDFGFVGVIPGFSLHDELALMVEAGLTPRQALRAATIEPVKALGLDRILGTIEPGKIADFVLLQANPLIDIRATTQILSVVSSGRMLDRGALDGLLNEAVAID